MPNQKTLIRMVDALNADLRLVPRSKNPRWSAQKKGTENYSNDDSNAGKS
jgi:hypothetical protein